MNKRNRLFTLGLLITAAAALVLSWPSSKHREMEERDSGSTTSMDVAGDLHRQPREVVEPEKIMPPAPMEGESADAGHDLEEMGEALTRFGEWAEIYFSTRDPVEKMDLLATGVELAGARREAMKTLIRTDPRAALEAAVSWEERELLPHPVASLLEKPVSGVGHWDVFGVAPLPGQTPDEWILRTFEIQGNHYRAYVYGDRLAQRSSRDVFAHGIAVDGLMAVHESPVRIVSAAERVSLNITPLSCPVDEEAMGLPHRDDLSGKIVAETAIGVMAFCCEGHLAAYETAAADEFRILAAPYASLGDRSILVIRVDFSQAPGESVSEGDAYQTMMAVDRFFLDASFRQFWFRSIHVTEGNPLRMPKSVADYLDPGGEEDEETGEISPPGYQILHQDARAAAVAAGYVTDYDFVMVAFPPIGYPWAGLGRVGGGATWIQGSFNTGVVAHELGHNFGLFHAAYWKPLGPVSGSRYPADNARRLEYGNAFDVMGGAYDVPRNHFSGNFKNIIDWLPDTHLHRVETGIQPEGPLRLFRLDGGGALNPARRHSIRVENPEPADIPAAPAKDLWIDFRQLFTTSERAMNGVVVQWGDDGSPEGSHLLNLNPVQWPVPTLETALRIGETFSFPNHGDTGLLITPSEKGGTAPHEYMDVLVTWGKLEIQFISPKQEFSVANPEGRVVFSPDLTANLRAEASATGSPLENVRFLADGELLGEAVETVPGIHAFDLVLSPLAGRSFDLTAVVVNAAGNAISTPPIPVRVAADQAGLRRVTLEIDSLVPMVNESVDLTATLSEDDWGEHPEVEFWANDILLGTVSTPPHRLDWVPDEPGEYVLRAMVTWENGMVQSPPVEVTVISRTEEMHVAFLPESIHLGESVLVSVDPFLEPEDGSAVDLVVDGRTLADLGAGPPYEINWTPISTGVHEVRVLVYGADGDYVLSRPFFFTVLPPAFTLSVSDTVPTAGEQVTLRAFSPVDYWKVESIVLELDGQPLWTTHDKELFVPWTPAKPGFHQLRARAVDLNGFSSESPLLRVAVYPPLEVDWSLRPPIGTFHIFGGAAGFDTVVTVGAEGRIHVSADLNNWTMVPPPVTVDLLAVAHGGGQFVAVGREGIIMTSSDGFDWSQAPSGTEADLKGVAFGGGLFTAVGQSGVILRSFDGMEWAEALSPTTMPLHAVVFSGTEFIAAGEKGKVLFSPDGLEWRAETVSPGISLHGVVFGMGMVLAVGHDNHPDPARRRGVMARRAENGEWGLRSDPSWQPFLSVTHANRSFLVTGGLGTLLTSFDGARWFPGNTNTINAFHASIPVGGGFLALGRWGTFRSSGPFPVETDSYMHWLALNFSLEERREIARTLPNHHLPGSTLTNLERYSFGLGRETTPPPAHRPAGTLVLHDGREYFGLRFRFPAAVRDVAYRVEISPDLVHWTEIGPESFAMEPEDSGWVWVTARGEPVRSDSASRFMRLSLGIIDF